MSHQPRASPWVTGGGNPALKGQKPNIKTMLLPFQGDGCASSIPRAVPWSMSLLALQADYRLRAHNGSALAVAVLTSSTTAGARHS